MIYWVLFWALFWLFVNTWIGVCKMAKVASIDEWDDIKLLILISILSYPLVMLIYKILKHKQRKRR